MADRPTREELRLLHRFLARCEWAANPPPPPAPRAFDPVLLANALAQPLFAPMTAADTLLGGVRYAGTLSDVLGDGPAPFDSSEALQGDRTARIAQLAAWLHRFPAFVWMRQQPAVASGFEAFKRVSKRRAGQAKFTDDLAHFRYWEFAADAVMAMDVRGKPEPTAEQRRQAGAAAQKLLELAADTKLLRSAGIGYGETKGFVAALEKLQAPPMRARRKRVDAYSADREYVELLALIAVHQFGDAPPAVICELAAMKVRNPDKVAITKQVSEFKKANRKA
jgi:hypothetical protein